MKMTTHYGVRYIEDGYTFTTSHLMTKEEAVEFYNSCRKANKKSTLLRITTIIEEMNERKQYFD